MHEIIQLISQDRTMEKIELEEFSRMKVGPMKFEIEAYDIKGVGRISAMKGSALFNLMKMDTIILSSYNKDMPLFSYDRIRVGKKDTLIVEIYDTCKEHKEYENILKAKEKFSEYPLYKAKPAWYDSLRCKESFAVTYKKKHDFDTPLKEYMDAFMKAINEANDISREEKKILNAKYVDGLLENGGPSTDMFVKKIGKEKTSLLFRKYLFGTEE